MTEEERIDLERAEDVCRRFLTWDLEVAKEDEDVDVKQVLRQVLGKDSNDR